MAGGPDKWCFEDRRAEWLQMRATRNWNDRWLRSTARDPITGITCMAKAVTITNRMKPRYNAARACRCGATPNTSVVLPRAYLCMGCEGIVNFAIPCGIVAEQAAAAACGLNISANVNRYSHFPRELRKRPPGNQKYATRSRGDMSLRRTVIL